MWQLIFFTNVFFACISFSIVMPSLYLYLDGMGASTTFYALVVAAFSVGEALGSLFLGTLSNTIGCKRTLQLCTLLSLSGSSSYALADTIAREGSTALGPPVVLLGRLLQGIGSGGQQAVEQTYLSVAAPPEQRTQLTSKLSTFACLGFIFGPAMGALVSQTPTFAVGPVRFTTFTKQGWVVAVLNVSMFLSTTFGFTEIVRKQGEAAKEEGDDKDASTSSAAVTDGENDTTGVWACIVIFFVHFNGFAVQETITTPLVEDWFGWDEVGANLLFTAAGMANLLVAVLMAFLSSSRVNANGEMTQLVDDRVLLWWSLVLAVAGWVIMIPIDAWTLEDDTPAMGLPQFIVGFALVTVAFPVGRGVCLSMVGKLLGDQPQGAWMGIMFALGAIARIAGPFWAVTGYYSFGALAVFGSTALLFVLSLGATRQLWSSLAPPDVLPLPALGGLRHTPGRTPRRTPGGTTPTRFTSLYHRSPSLTPTQAIDIKATLAASPLSQTFALSGSYSDSPAADRAKALPAAPSPLVKGKQSNP